MQLDQLKELSVPSPPHTPTRPWIQRSAFDKTTHLPDPGSCAAYLIKPQSIKNHKHIKLLECVAMNVKGP